MTNQATFKESDRKRPWYRRLTPVAWVLIGVVALSCVACGFVGTTQVTPALLRSGDEWATGTPVPTQPTAESTKGPSPTPTEWWEDGATATPEPTEVVDPFPAWWADEMTQDADGQWWPPDEVVEMVKENYNEGLAVYKAFMGDTRPPDLDSFEEAAPTYFSGEYLNAYIAYLDSVRVGDRSVGLCEWDLCLLSAQEFGADGLECNLSVACQDGTCVEIDPVTGDQTSVPDMPHSGLSLYRMIYNPSDGHWKINHLVEYVPPPK